MGSLWHYGTPHRLDQAPKATRLQRLGQMVIPRLAALRAALAQQAERHRARAEARHLIAPGVAPAPTDTVRAAVELAPRPPLPRWLWQGPLGLALVAILVWGLVPTGNEAPAPPPPPSSTLRAEIQSEGPALFYAVHDDRRFRIWTVHCRTPLRGCVARAPGLAIRLDDQHRPWLIAPLAPEAQLSVKVGTRRARHIDNLFSQPLDDRSIARLSAPKASLQVEENGEIVAATPTEGLDEVLSYLAWLKSDKGRTLRDARLWPGGATLDLDVLPPRDRARYLAERRAIAAQTNRAPVTVPPDRGQIMHSTGPAFFSP